MSVQVPLCRIGDIEPGGAKGFTLTDSGRDSLFVVRRDDEAYGYWNLCPHQGSSLPWREDEYLGADGQYIVCSGHGAEFDIATGACVRGAAHGLSLIPVNLEVTDDGMIKAEVAQLPGCDANGESGQELNCRAKIALAKE